MYVRYMLFNKYSILNRLATRGRHLVWSAVGVDGTAVVTTLTAVCGVVVVAAVVTVAVACVCSVNIKRSVPTFVH